MSENYAQLGKNFKAAGADVNPLFRQESHADTPWEVLEELRPELYGIVAVIAEQAMDQNDIYIDNYPPYGLHTQGGTAIEHVGSFEDLRQAATNTLQFAASRCFVDAKKVDSPLYKRLDYLQQLFFKGTEKDRYKTSGVLIGAGLLTAVMKSTEVLKAVARKVEEHEPSADSTRIAEVARSSGGLIIKMASLPLSQLDSASIIINEAGEPPIPNTLTHYQGLRLKTRTDGTTYVDFEMPISQMPCPIRQGQLMGNALPPTFRRQGCPALAHLTVGKESAVIRTYHWMIDIAEQENLFVGADIHREMTLAA